ncbi:MAG: hypothetical protein HQL32_11435 [Planctomycetes bacterium]|nr:hypothetical protein [Planctomycetota bacterium]
MTPLDPWMMDLLDLIGAGDNYHDGMNLYQGCFAPNYSDPSGMACWITWSCTLKGSFGDDPDNEKYCEYDCKETNRQTASGGTKVCRDIKKPKGTLTRKYYKRLVDTILTLGCPNCKKTLDDFREPYNFNPDDNLLPNVNYKTCINTCEGGDDAAGTICKLLKGPAMKACKIAVDAGEELCKTYCESFQY